MGLGLFSGTTIPPARPQDFVGWEMEEYFRGVREAMGSPAETLLYLPNLLPESACRWWGINGYFVGCGWVGADFDIGR